MAEGEGERVKERERVEREEKFRKLQLRKKLR